jgi:hypothetical protein
MNTKIERLKRANELLEVIASCGHRFFWSEEFDRVSKFEIGENGRLYFIDKYRGERLPLSHMTSNHWDVKFTEGGTLQRLIRHLAKFIRTGMPITTQYVFEHWENWCTSELWEYGEDMEKVREAAKKLEIF